MATPLPTPAHKHPPTRSDGGDASGGVRTGNGVGTDLVSLDTGGLTVRLPVKEVDVSANLNQNGLTLNGSVAGVDASVSVTKTKEGYKFSGSASMDVGGGTTVKVKADSDGAVSVGVSGAAGDAKIGRDKDGLLYGEGDLKIPGGPTLSGHANDEGGYSVGVAQDGIGSAKAGQDQDGRAFGGGSIDLMGIEAGGSAHSDGSYDTFAEVEGITVQGGQDENGEVEVSVGTDDGHVQIDKVDEFIERIKAKDKQGIQDEFPVGTGSRPSSGPGSPTDKVSSKSDDG